MTQSLSLDPATVAARVYMALLFLPVRLSNIPQLTRLAGSIASCRLPLPDFGCVALALAIVLAAVALVVHAASHVPGSGVWLHLLPETPLLPAFVGASLALTLTSVPAAVSVVPGLAMGNLRSAIGAIVMGSRPRA